jgi:hypothetical protein
VTKSKGETSPSAIRDPSIPLALRAVAVGAFVAFLACGLAALHYLRREHGRQLGAHGWAMTAVWLCIGVFLAAMAVIIAMRCTHDVRNWRARRAVNRLSDADD